MKGEITHLPSVVAFLKKASSYPYQPKWVKLIQTHASVIALAPPFVYKIKKPVDLGFLDFSSLEKRKADCEQEIKLNQRLCPDLYIGIVPICLKGKAIAFGREGEIVEYALQMHYMPEDCFLDKLLAAGKVDRAFLGPVLDTLQHFYEQPPLPAGTDSISDIMSIKNNTDENWETLQRFVGTVIHPAAYPIVHRYTHSFFRKNEKLFEDRYRQGWVKDCHGDLRLEHIHVQDEKVCVYDCIEFNERFRYIDVAADIAFLAMDFDYQGRPDLANFVVEQMAARLHDPDMKKPMDFYKCYRACVRAKVELLKAQEPEVEEKEKIASRAKAARYFQLALRYATCGSQPAVLLVGGKVGTGKSTVARQLAEMLGWEYRSSDVTRKNLAGLPLYERTDSHGREALYSEASTEAVYRSLLREATEALQASRGIVIDATFGRQRYRQLFCQALEQHNSRYCFIELEASEATIRRRLTQRETQPEVISDARLENYALLNQGYQPFEEVPASHRINVNAQGSVKDTVTKVLKGLAEKNEPTVAGA